MNRRRIISGTLVALLISGAFADVSDAQDWPQWRGIQRDAISPERGISNDWEANPPELMWTAEGLGSGYSGVSVAGDFIYSMGDFDDGQAVVAIDANSRSVVWKTTLTDRTPQHGHPGSRCTPTIDGDRLYVVTSDGQIACLSAEDGQVRWQRDFHDDWQGRMMSGWGFSESPLVDGDRLIVTPGANDGMLAALDKRTGKLIWKSAMPPNPGPAGKDGAGYSSIVISEAGGVKQYIQFVGRGVIGVDARSGRFLWGYNRIANGTANIPRPII
jgi:outer membrane protein assembly factor BamB